MIRVVNSYNLKDYADLYRGQFLLRHREFILRQDYDVKVFQHMEFDQYDTPATTYLVYSSVTEEVLGVSRLIPTTIRCMLTDLWSHALFDPSQIVSETTWEGTRFCVDSRLTPRLRKKIAQELCAAYLEYGLSNGIEKIVGLMHTLILKSVFGDSGINYTPLGKIVDVGSHKKVQAAGMDITHEQLANLRSVTGLGTVIEDRFKKQEQEGFKNAA